MAVPEGHPKIAQRFIADHLIRGGDFILMLQHPLMHLASNKIDSIDKDLLLFERRVGTLVDQSSLSLSSARKIGQLADGNSRAKEDRELNKVILSNRQYLSSTGQGMLNRQKEQFKCKRYSNRTRHGILL